MQDENATELPKQYDPGIIEGPITERWLGSKCFAAAPDERENSYVIMMPLPNVTGALHMGHAMDNVMQDLLIRWHRMMGDNTLWMAGTDHAGIATQAVVEKRLFELEGKTRHDIGREDLVKRIWAWKDEYQQRIVSQQQAMGCSCDWDRQRFTMDEVCERAVRHTFFKMFRDGLIYQGDRLVNWDCHLQTAVSDDELERKLVHGHFYHLRYPVIDPKPGEPSHIIVATTRPETMLGDTAVACRANPGAVLDELIAQAEQKVTEASDKDRADDQQALDSLKARKDSHLDVLNTIAAMAADGRQVMLPLQDRPIPIITDEWAKPELGSGCVKITPAHDPNDYEVWGRHKNDIDIVNILNNDGSLNDNAGDYQGLDRFEASKQIISALQERDLVEGIEDRDLEIDHSDRSKTIIEPYLSKQWFVRMSDIPDGVTLGSGTEREFKAPGLAQAAIDAVNPEWESPTGRNLTFHPDPVRYGKLYKNWLVEKRDWCISRQLWWGHRIPVWTGRWSGQQLLSMKMLISAHKDRDDVFVWVVLPNEQRMPAADALAAFESGELKADQVEIQVCFRDKDGEEAITPMLSSVGLKADPDVLDTWFSSALWPHATLGWPDPATAPIGEGQTHLDATDGASSCLDYFYPGSCLVTARDIITLWVARMQIMGLYNLGDVPFTDSFIHANIQDGKGNKMSKSAGNGIDPVDIIEQYGADAMRYVVCELQTGTQDVRLPVHAVSPFTGKTVDLAKAKHGDSIFTYLCPESGKEFDVLGTMQDHGIPAAKLFSERFEIGRAFCNKLWNSARFALMNLGEAEFRPLAADELAIEDRWILSRLNGAMRVVHEQLELYTPSAAINAAREFFWSDFCDWYVEIIKPRLRDSDQTAVARQVLAAVLDQILRLFHPFVPFITEAIWEKLNAQAPKRGIDTELPMSAMVINARWPIARDDWQDAAVETEFEMAQEVVKNIRDLRQSHGASPGKEVDVEITTNAATRTVLEPLGGLIAGMANASSIKFDAAAKPTNAATAVVKGMEIHVLGVVDVEKEIAKLEKQAAKIDGQIKGKRGKLENQGFLDKAPGAVVQKEQQALAQLEGELTSVQNTLSELRSN
ncbi:MAG: valine--tRNA ligase [Planctomycetota bacterium]|nr:valine--tRNA ligase [Planctomycetota bacterium]